MNFHTKLWRLAAGVKVFSSNQAPSINKLGLEEVVGVTSTKEKLDIGTHQVKPTDMNDAVERKGCIWSELTA